MMARTQRTYAIYARLSRLPDGSDHDDAETVDRQMALCRRYAAEEGLRISDDHIYPDNNRSAWKPSGRREQWNAMIAAGRRGEFDGILAYKLDRFTRNPRDGEDLIDLADNNRRLRLDGPGGNRIDLSSGDGRKAFRDAVNSGSYESDKTSERVKDAFDDRVARGLLLGGGRLYGFEVLSRSRDKYRDVTPRQREDEVEVIREVARRMLAGEALAHIADDLNERGLVTVRGGRWTGANLGRMIGADRYGGWTERNGKRYQVPGEPILDEETFESVQAMLASRRRGRRPTGRWPLTGIMVCGNPGCTGDHTLAGHREQRNQVRRYICAPGNGGCGLSIRADKVEDIVTDRVLTDLADEDEVAELNKQAAAINEAWEIADAKVEALDEQLADLEVKFQAGETRRLAYERSKPVLMKRIAEAEREREELSAASRQARSVPAVSKAEWEAMSPTEKRQLIGRLHLSVTILPLPKGAPRSKFCPDRVVIEP